LPRVKSCLLDSTPSNQAIPSNLLLLLIPGHLTTANVFIENGVAKLSAIENFICGVPSFYRPFFVQHSKVNSMELIDVFTFGHVLFEMQSTYSLQEPYIREINDCPALLSKRNDSDGDV
jgi:PX domain-containing protein kinase-like protein